MTNIILDQEGIEVKRSKILTTALVRLAAIILDTLPFYLLAFIAYFLKVIIESLQNQYISLSFIELSSVALGFFPIYKFFMHAFFGGRTWAKMMVGIQVVRADLTPIGFKEAFIRSAPGLFWSIVVLTCFFLYYFRTDFFFNLPLYPTEIQYILTVITVLYILIDAAWLFTNKKKVTLHDALAGTYVVTTYGRKKLVDSQQQPRL